MNRTALFQRRCCRRERDSSVTNCQLCPFSQQKQFCWATAVPIRPELWGSNSCSVKMMSMLTSAWKDIPENDRRNFGKTRPMWFLNFGASLWFFSIRPLSLRWGARKALRRLTPPTSWAFAIAQFNESTNAPYEIEPKEQFLPNPKQVLNWQNQRLFV